MKVAIAGAGIGGLAAALALARRGHEVVVCERAAEQGEVGAGVQISPNAMRALDAWGIAAEVERISVFPSRLVVRRWRDDAVLRATPFGEGFLERFGHRYANVHRGELAGVLRAAIVQDHPSVRIRLASPVSGVVTGEDDAPPALLLADGSAEEADVVIGADGIRSAVRGALFGVTPSRFSGAVAYRALVPRELVADLALEVTNRVGPDAHVVSYFVGEGARWLNLVCIVPESVWDVEAWTEPGSPDDLRASFAAWSPTLQRVLDRVGEPVYRWALHDRQPLTEWGRGAVTLLGDACHPMLPFLAQGACQAIEDAAVLSNLLDSAACDGGPRGLREAVRRYEELRRPRTARVQQVSWRNRELFHLPDGDAQRRRDESFAVAGDDLSVFDWLYGYVPPDAS